MNIPNSASYLSQCFVHVLQLNIISCRLVVIAMEAMDQLLVACHAQTLNLFVESFLKMVQKLLESTEPQLQILATQSVSSWALSNNLCLDHKFFFYLASAFHFFFSLFGLQTLKKIHHRTIGGMISLCPNSLQCATVIIQIESGAIKSDLLESRVSR